jgi:hypothetical protein
MRALELIKALKIHGATDTLAREALRWQSHMQVFCADGNRARYETDLVDRGPFTFTITRRGKELLLADK